MATIESDSISNSHSTPKVDPKPVCKYGSKCYRRNDDHLRQYRHPQSKNSTQESTTPKRPIHDEIFAEQGHSSVSLDKPDGPQPSKKKKIVDDKTKGGPKISDYFKKNTTTTVHDDKIKGGPKISDYFRKNTTTTVHDDGDKKDITLKRTRSLPAEKVTVGSSKDVEENEAAQFVNKRDITAANETYKFMRDCEQLDSFGNCESPEIAAESKRDEEEVKDCIDESADLPRLDSPIGNRENIKQKYKMEMPDDFYEFWSFCEKLNPSNPTEALLPLLGFTLVGPYDILAGVHKKSRKTRPNYMLHYRYYYDPPELMTVIKGDDSDQFHIGYYRDEPSELPAYVASNSATHGCALSPKGDNLFTALKYFIKERLKDDDFATKTRASLEDLHGKVIAEATKHGHNLDLRSAAMKAREKRVVCKTMNGAGLVVFVDKNDVGYRPVPETLADLKKMLKRIADSATPTERDKNFSALQELITLVQFANDECDYGEGLELGLQLFCYGHKTFHSVISHLLPLAYELLNRQLYADIIRAHLQHRHCNCWRNQLDP